MPRLRKGKWDKPGVWASRNTRTPTLGYIVPPGRALEAAFGSVEEFGPFVVTEPNSPENMADYADHPVVLEYLGRLNDGEARPGLEHVSDLVSAKWLGGTQWGETPVPMGRIGFIQEPGYKLRSVANPWSILQVIGSHLGNQLYDTLLHDIPEDCTFDQDQGVRDVQTYLRDSDQDLMSIDLSSATDRFPLSFTLEVLGAAGAAPQDLWLMKEVSRGDWVLPDRTRISWTNGQPLGWYPSFGAFAFSHHALARLCQPTFYRILGDDIVIDKIAGEKLVKYYEAMQLPISWDKSITSAQLAEFGGRLITADRVYIQPKWKDVSDRSYLDLARNLGPRSLAMFKPRQRATLRVLAHALPDIYPLGLNWNLKGLSYKEREELSYRLRDA
jgi:hypothetical protein